MKHELKLAESHSTSSFLWLLRVTCFCIFLGRAWQHLVWDAPFRALLWDQQLMQAIVESITGLTWEEYTTSRNSDLVIQSLIRFTGVVYAFCAFLCLFITSRNRWGRAFLLVGAVFLFILAFLNCKEKFYQAGEMMEHAIQIIAPVLLYSILFTNPGHSSLLTLAKVAVAFTFIGHGLYAVNYYPQPGPFVDMMINILHFEEERAKNYLFWFGILDFLFSILIFIPAIAPSALIYCAAWGLITAAARLVAGFDIRFAASTLNQYSFETIFRLGNFLLPLWIFYMREQGIPTYLRSLSMNKIKLNFVKKKDLNKCRGLH